MSRLTHALLMALGLTAFSLHAMAAEPQVVLKVHHHMPLQSVTQKDFLDPWAKKISEASEGRIQFQFYPSMQLGGTPPQLIDQVRDGVADIVWTLPGYSTGRFPLISVFEQPFMSSSAEATSQAMWVFMQRHGEKELAGLHLLATQVTDGAQIHTNKRQIKTMADFRGLKIRASNRTATKLISLLGATPVAMPVPQIPEALSKGVVDGAIVPWDVVPPLKLQELVKYHTETAPGEPTLMYTTMILAMNPDSYAKLPDDLKKIIDDNSGLELSRTAGRLYDTQVVETGHKMAQAQGNQIYVLPKEETAKWEKVGQRLYKDWIEEVESKGYTDGAGLLEEARSLIRQYSTQPAQ